MGENEYQFPTSGMLHLLLYSNLNYSVKHKYLLNEWEGKEYEERG